MTDQPKKNEPVHRVSRGSIEAAVWENASNGRTWHNVQIYRRYKTDGGEFREANTYALADLVQVSKVAELAEQWITSRLEELARPDASRRDRP
jgi:hypothetical protein